MSVQKHTRELESKFWVLRNLMLFYKAYSSELKFLKIYINKFDWIKFFFKELKKYVKI